MIKTITTNNLPIKAWLNNIEEGALQQAHNIAQLPFAFSHVALMPDCHQGFGMPIGGVLATSGAIIPNAVGMDIGCGMFAVKTSLTDVPTQNKIEKIIHDIKNKIPVGHKHHANKQSEHLMPEASEIVIGGIVEKELEAAHYQIGTLGGGNHFIELQKGSDGHLWIMVHSGSRNIGKQVAVHYNQLAKKVLEHTKNKQPRDLAHFMEGSPEFNNYITEMDYCIRFAFANRKLMMDRITETMYDYFGNDFKSLQFINIAHNYAALEEHFNKKVIVHRKGATRANKGELGIIPGSQGTSSYVVEGLGNTESFRSCSHGAGRKMGRKQAQRSLNLKEQQEIMNSQGIVHSINKTNDLDEAPDAYKNIDEVMQNQKDLVKVMVKLTPLAVIKG